MDIFKYLAPKSGGVSFFSLEEGFSLKIENKIIDELLSKMDNVLVGICFGNNPLLSWFASGSSLNDILNGVQGHFPFIFLSQRNPIHMF